MRLSARILPLFFLLITLFLSFPPKLWAQQVPPTIKLGQLTPAPMAVPTVTIDPTQANWQVDVEVTEVGKSSERARQFLYWVLSHPSIDSVPVLAQMWAFSRNIVYIFVVLVLVFLGLFWMLSRRHLGPTFTGIGPFNFSPNLPSLFLKIGAILLFVTLSYVLILGLIQIGDLLMRFFIEQVGGKDLFNIFFAPNIKDNYINFVGYRDMNFLHNESAKTSLFLIRLTSFTYNFLAIILILRTVILWFLLIVSPFLAILMPFIFIRNAGWMWIGTFFQWLFYGPLVALFLGSLARIWGASDTVNKVSGIPYPFDFSLVGQPGGQVFKTAINILVGGPAQTLSPTNSLNYIDTYAEYVIALVMLWAMILLPWLLLRIFRDYCCDVFRANQAAITSLFDRLKGITPPPPPAPPPSEKGLAFELPFRRVISLVQKINLENTADVQRAQTQQIVEALGVSVSSLQDIAQFEMNAEKQKMAQVQLESLSQPEKIAAPLEREKFVSLRSEITSRARAGDRLAQRMISASEKKTEEVLRSVPTVMPVGMVQPQILTQISQKTGLTKERVSEILRVLPTIGITEPARARLVAQKAGVSEAEVAKVLLATPALPTVALPAKPPTVTVEDYEEVKRMWLTHYRQAEVPVSEKIKSRQDWLKNDAVKITNTLNLLQSLDPKMKEKGIEEVAAILPFLLLGGFSQEETVTYLKAKFEAARLVLEEMEEREKVKEEAKKEAEEELVEAPTAKKEEAKAETLEAEKAEKIEEKGPESEPKEKT